MQNNSRNPLPLIIAIVILIALAAGGLLLMHRHKQENNAQKPITSFLIENAATPGQSSSDFAQEQLKLGDTARVDIHYNPQLLHSLAVRFVGSNGKAAKTTDPVTLDDSGSYHIDIATAGLAADIYRLELLNQDSQVVDFGELTLTSQ